MERELATRTGIAATIVARAAAGDAVASSRTVAAHHDDIARVCFVIVPSGLVDTLPVISP
jgi:hypothetical protein